MLLSPVKVLSNFCKFCNKPWHLEETCFKKREQVENERREAERKRREEERQRANDYKRQEEENLLKYLAEQNEIQAEAEKRKKEDEKLAEEQRLAESQKNQEEAVAKQNTPGSSNENETTQSTEHQINAEQEEEEDDINQAESTVVQEGNEDHPTCTVDDSPEIESNEIAEKLNEIVTRNEISNIAKVVVQKNNQSDASPNIDTQVGAHITVEHSSTPEPEEENDGGFTPVMNRRSSRLKDKSSTRNKQVVIGSLNRALRSCKSNDDLP